MLEVEVEAQRQDEDDGHINVRVLDVKNWPEVRLDGNPVLEDAVKQGALDLSTWTQTSARKHLSDLAPAFQIPEFPAESGATPEQ
ncbi:hypothetical protein [Deinococcus peraridilitoris]|uniref:hypothetical protein n=1 Tax=Deinococcus peraridilitoris TaxID=432329 RepID=UPI00031E38EC|nr:hypothetical protein [Deinococcus peraridilitoris]